MNLQIDEQKQHYESTVNEKSSIVKTLSSKLLDANSEILSLKTLFTKKSDIEEQLRANIEHVTQIEKAKMAL